MITVRKCSQMAEAQLIKSVLERSGVAAFVPNVSAILWNTSGGFCVEVVEGEYDRATEILRQFDRDESNQEQVLPD
jgi:hypothetical protein